MISHRGVTFVPSPRLQRLGPVRAVLSQYLVLRCSLRFTEFRHCVRTSSLVVFQRSPLHRHSPFASCPVASRRGLPRPDAAKRQTPSTLVVPPDFGGLLRKLLHRLVASCSQSWGSNRFRLGLPSAVSPHQLVLPVFPWFAPHTLRSIPLSGSRITSP